jgi:hypothetical protein
VEANFSFDVEAWEIERRAESDPEAAAQLMQIAAKYIREGQPFPMGLREWIANALDDAALKPARYRAKALTDALRLTANNRRPKGDWLTIGAAFEDLITDGKSQTQAADQIAGDHDIDQRTATRYWREFLRGKEIHDSIE